MDVGFIGLGKMGIAMARNLAKAGHKVRAWNRSRVNAQGLDLVKSAREAFQAEAVFTMLSDDAALRAVVLDGGLLKDARKGTVHIGCSTISIAFAEELTARHAEAGVGYISAPVFGRPDVAEAAQLNVVVGGAESAIDKTAPLLAAIGKKTWVMGDHPAQANAAKIAGNMMIGMAIGAMSEAALLAEATAWPPRRSSSWSWNRCSAAGSTRATARRSWPRTIRPGSRCRSASRTCDSPSRRRSAPASICRSSRPCATR
jgi:3-hydroxyisobutyrate dehydrogenase-like beta-hydroxyacid dehydrogenase